MFEENFEIVLQLMDDQHILGFYCFTVEEGKIVRQTDKVASGEITMDELMDD